MNELLLQGGARNSKECSKWRLIVYFAPFATSVIKWYVGKIMGYFLNSTAFAEPKLSTKTLISKKVSFFFEICRLIYYFCFR